jgi:hypothetical protein
MNLRSSILCLALGLAGALPRLHASPPNVISDLPPHDGLDLAPILRGTGSVGVGEGVGQAVVLVGRAHEHTRTRLRRIVILVLPVCSPARAMPQNRSP